MPCRNVSWVAGLVCAFIMMLGPMGRTVDNMRNLTTVTPEMEEVLSEAWAPTSAPNMEMVSPFALKHYVRQSQSLSAGEKEIIQKRKSIILKSLNRLNIMATLDSVPHIALLGSGGGQRAAVSLLGSLYQMEKEDILDTVLYLGGVSGSAWSMISLYSDPQWSIDNIDRAVSRLSGPGVGLEEAFTWLTKRSKEEHFSLADIWGVMTAAGIMKQLNNQSLSEDGIKATNPYPIYNAVDKNCLQSGPEKGKWFEITPHEAGFTDLGLFINTSHLNSRSQEAGLKHKGTGMDNIWLQGVVGSAIADESRLQDNFPDWLKGVVGIAATDENNLLDLIFLWTEVPQQVKNSWDVLDFFKRGCHTLLKLIELIRKKTKDPAVLSDLDNLQKTLKEHLNLNAALFKKKSPKEKKLILEQWGQKMLEPLKKWSQSLDEGPVKENISWLTEKVFPLIGKWKWGTTNNFLYQYPDAVVPSCIRREKHLQLIDAGLMLNTPYPPFLGEKRDVDLLIALDFASDLPFTTLILARDYAAKMKKPFPEIDDKILQEKDWPKDCYVFEGKDKQPTIVYMPLFNTRNCKDAEDFKAKMEEFATFQLPYNQEKIEFLLETAKSNIKNNKATLANEVYKATVRRYHKSLSRKSSEKPDH